MKKLMFLSLAVIGLTLGGCQSQVNTESSGVSTADSTLEANSPETNSSEANSSEGTETNTSNPVVLVDTGSEKITSGGNYQYSGTLKEPIIVDSTEAVEITLDQVTMSMDTVCIFVANGDVTLNLKGESSLENTTSDVFSYQDEKIDAVIYTKDDLLIKGSGTLHVSSKMHGIVCKDALTLNAAVDVTSEKTAVRGKDAIEVSDAKLTISAGTDGLKSDGDDGTITIKSGDIQVSAKDDAIQAVYKLTVGDGALTLSGKECLEATLVTVNGGTIEIQASDDGINAAQKVNGVTPEVNISGGDIKIVMADGDTDGIDSNGNLFISGGTIDITAASPFDYDGEGSLTGGTVSVNGQQVTTLQNQMGGPGGNGGRGSRDGNGRGGRWGRRSYMEENV